MATLIESLQLDALTADPSTPVEGQVWYNTTAKRLKIYRNGVVQEFNDRAELTAHTGSTSNPHSVTAAQVGNTTAQWNANQLQGRSVVATAPTSGQALCYNTGATQWEPTTVTVGGMVYSSNTTATGTITTTSTTDVLATSMTVTPAAGTYLVLFTGSAGNGTNSASTFMSIWYNSAQIADSERRVVRSSSAVEVPFTCVAVVTVSGALAIEGRWRVSAGTGSMYQRSLTVMKVG